MIKRLLGLFNRTDKTVSEVVEKAPKVIKKPAKAGATSATTIKKKSSTNKSKPIIEVIDKRTTEEKSKTADDFAKLQMALINWIPPEALMEERDYQNSLIRHLAPKFDKVVAGKGKYKADILVNDTLPIEITLHLDTENKYDLLCDQAEHYLDEFDKAILVIVGEINATLSENLEKRYKGQQVVLVKKLR